MATRNPSAHSGGPPNSHQQRLEECFRRGTQLMTSDRNHDYAHVMLAQCVVHEPGNLRYVEGMLKNLCLKTQGQPRRARSIFSRGNKELRKAHQAKAWRDVFRIGLDALKDNPWDVATLCSLAEACAASHFNEVELAYLKQALDANPKDVDVNRHCAQSLARMGQFDQAIACWHRVEEIKKGDREAARMVAELYQEKLKYPGGRPVAVAQPQRTDQSEEGTESLEPAIVELTPRQQLERAIAERPGDPSNYLQLVELHLEQNRLDEAESLLNRAIASCGPLPAWEKYLRKVRKLRAERAAEVAKALEAKRADSKSAEWSFRMPWMELLLGLTVAMLGIQLYPPAAAALMASIDFRHWSRGTWFLVNIYAVLLLLVIRFSSNLYSWWRKL